MGLKSVVSTFVKDVFELGRDLILLKLDLKGPLGRRVGAEVQGGPLHVHQAGLHGDQVVADDTFLFGGGSWQLGKDTSTVHIVVVNYLDINIALKMIKYLKTIID